MKVSNVKYFSTINGDGIRTAVFVSGCRLHCDGCFNKIAWDFNYGLDFNDELIEKILESMNHEYIDGLAILGGEPMDPNNQLGVYTLISRFRERYGNSKNIWMWTGYYKDAIPNMEFTDLILKEVDVLVDGPFMKERKVVGEFRGSDNQTILRK